MNEFSLVCLCPTVKHSMRFYFTLCSGLPNLPEFTIVGDFEEVRMGYYDSSMKAPEARHDWLRKLMEEDPEHWQRIVLDSMRYQQLLQGETEGFKQNSSQTAGELLNRCSVPGLMSLCFSQCVE